MNCAHCEDRISDYLENALDAADSAAIETHLQSCSTCTELLNGVRDVMYWGRNLQVQLPAPWLPTRIISNTPHVVRVTWRDWAANAWKSLVEPRFALAMLTSTLMLGWMGSLAGISVGDVAMVRHPSAIYYRMGGWANRLYGDAVRGVYSSSLVNAIQCQIHSRFEQFRENS
ncbi:MAG TPA: zf-HC2 domain-containing protein [Terriglobia bacterium]|nr:zf-HC2 domain-containing protein [Terriglobia bacterium]